MYEQVQKIFDIFAKHNYEVFIAGGAVRDIVMGISPHDYDFTTNAIPNEIISIFESEKYKTIPTGIEHGTVTVLVDNITFEITTYRKDTLCDGRHCIPEFAHSLEEDISRRDFTINALAMDRDNNIIDLVNGLEDIKNKIIRTVGDPYQRFQEDYLRILRAIRFSSKLNFEIHPDTYEAIKKLHHNLNKISKERIRDEFSKILLSPYRTKGLLMLYDTNIIDIIIPDFSKLAEIQQPPQFHPEGDVLTHSTLTVSSTEENDPLHLILSAILHDIGKFEAYAYDLVKKRITFNGHDAISSQRSKEILFNLKYDTDTIDKVAWLISNHMAFHDDPNKLRKSTIKKLMLTKIEENYLPNPLFEDLIKLHKYDVLASDKDLKNYYVILEREKEIRVELLKEPPKRLITGYDVMNLGISPGPIISELMSKVEDAQLEGIIKTKEEALNYLKELL